MAQEPIKVTWYVNINQENEYKVNGVLLEVLKDQRGLYARVDDGSFGGPKLLDLWRLDHESYLRVQAAFPDFWPKKNTSE
jgi:hypothetical protein